jgi:hypothetical protein
MIKVNLLLACLSVCILPGTASAVTVYYNNDFSDNATGWALSNTPQISSRSNTVENGTLIYSSTNNDDQGGARMFDSVGVTGVAGNSFTMTSSFVIDPSTALNANSSIGFNFLNTSNNQANAYGTNQGYYALIRGDGVLQLGTIFANPGPSFTLMTDVATVGSLGNLLTGTAYTITLDGIYTTGGLAINFTVSTAANSVSISTLNDLVSPYAGNNFGYAMTQFNGSRPASQFNVAFDYFNISEYQVIPEPATCILLSLGLATLFLLRRKTLLS